MKVSFESKFNTGDIVKVRGSSQRFVIDEVITHTGLGSTKILYVGIVLTPNDSVYRMKDDPIGFICFGDKQNTISENLLEAILSSP